MWVEKCKKNFCGLQKMYATSNNYFLLLLVFCTTSILAKDNGLGLTPPMGWNTWCTLGKCGKDFCNDKEIMSIADTMEANGMRDLGYTYINLDDCWADYRDENGNIVPDINRFPNGMAPVIKYLNKKGFKFGLYTDSGTRTCSNGGRNHSIPGSYGHYEQDAASYASWGVEYVKMDWCNTKGVNLDPHVAYGNMSRALDKTGKKIWLSSCEWGVMQPWLWMKKYANSWRTGPDHHDNWDSTSNIIEINAELGVYAGPGGWNDPDFIYTGGQGCDPPVDFVHCPGQTDIEYRTEFSMWCLMAAPLLVATDIRNLTDIMKEVLFNKEMIAINQDPLGKGGNRIGYSFCILKACQIWSKDLSDGGKAIGLYNPNDLSYKIHINFIEHFNWPVVFMRDLWKLEDVGVVKNSFSVLVLGHGVEVYKIMKHN